MNDDNYIMAEINRPESCYLASTRARVTINKYNTSAMPVNNVLNWSKFNHNQCNSRAYRLCRFMYVNR